jgi:hypothetical protein
MTRGGGEEEALRAKSSDGGMRGATCCNEGGVGARRLHWPRPRWQAQPQQPKRLLLLRQHSRE